VRSTPTVVATALFCLAGCGDTSGHQRPEELYLTFNDAKVGSPLSGVHNDGRDDVHINLHTSPSSSPEAVAAQGFGKGEAARFPAYTGDGKPAASILVVRPTSRDDLSPRAHDFSFGASFKLDQQSEGTADDNGNNLVQRGAFDGPAQFKAQVDAGIPSCRVLADDGELMVQAPKPIEPDHWYTMTCQRSKDALSLTLRAEDGGPGAGTWEKEGTTGRLSFGDVPLTVGGKTDENGEPVRSADQFNGVVDDVFFQRLD
jgi:hypothetical protein